MERLYNCKEHYGMPGENMPVKMQESVITSTQGVTLTSNIEECLRLAFELREVSEYIDNKIVGSQSSPVSVANENGQPCLHATVAKLECVLRDAKTILTRLADNI